MVFWTVTIVVSVKYVVLILRADNNGEGGLVALLALASQAVRRPAGAAPAAALRRHPRHRDLLRRRRHHAGDLGHLRGRGHRAGGARPARLRRAAHAGDPDRLLHVPAPRHRAGRQAVRAVHAGLVRRAGAARRWRRSSATRRSCAASRRTTALLFVVAHPALAFVALGSVVLCITGAEALYADMGHFGKRPIRARLVRAWRCRRCCSTTSARARCCWRSRRRRATRSTRWRRPGASIR